jgi:histidinol-phosphate/aromatic aminotransferase/cobyric acid decarboxylase-like protein
MTLTIRLAGDRDREAIYRMRHRVYAEELGQHARRPDARLRDDLDGCNQYIVAARGEEIVGFVSVTPPQGGRLSIDKYLTRDRLPFAVAADLYEVRILTVDARHRRGPAAGLLMYAALRWVEARGGRRIVAMGRTELRELYDKVGLRALGIPIQSGAVSFELMLATVADGRQRAERELEPVLARMGRRVDWRLAPPFRPPGACPHGGASIDELGDELQHLDRRPAVIDADVLDAWFPPAPQVEAAVREDVGWLLRTSPPVQADGLVRAIARARDLPEASVVPAAGSSNLIFLALPLWLTPASRALLLDPMYGEYAHVLETIVGCRVDRLPLERPERFRLSPERLAAALRSGYDLVVLVNPNNPTGLHVPRVALETVLREVPSRTLVWVDETYVDYVGSAESVERTAAASDSVVVCKSMSKAYALSGVRAAYLCAPPRLAAELRRRTPPWAVSLPAQLAALRALASPAYYAARYAETRRLREELASGLGALPGVTVVSHGANFVLGELDARLDGPAVLARCRARGLYLRELPSVSPRTFRVAVKASETNRRIVAILSGALQGGGGLP